nr:hypothetical protein [Halomonas olivaria]
MAQALGGQGDGLSTGGRPIEDDIPCRQGQVTLADDQSLAAFQACGGNICLALSGMDDLAAFVGQGAGDI